MCYISYFIFVELPSPGVTNKKEWDTFARQCGNRSVFPSSLGGMYKKNKVELFNLWLDSGRDWDRTVITVERLQETKNLNRKEWRGVKAKDLKTQMGETKALELIAKRQESGLWYKDDDFPDDPEDCVCVCVLSAFV